MKLNDKRKVDCGSPFFKDKLSDSSYVAGHEDEKIDRYYCISKEEYAKILSE